MHCEINKYGLTNIGVTCLKSTYMAALKVLQSSATIMLKIMRHQASTVETLLRDKVWTLAVTQHHPEEHLVPSVLPMESLPIVHQGYLEGHLQIVLQGKVVGVVASGNLL